MLKLPKQQWFEWFDGTSLDSISQWVKYYYIDPENYAYNDEGTIINIDDVIGVVDLGTLTWSKYTKEGQWLFHATINDGPSNVGYGNPVRIYCTQYKCNSTALNGGTAVMRADKNAYWDTTNPEILIKDTSYTEATAFKEAMNGVMLIYGKANSPL